MTLVERKLRKKAEKRQDGRLFYSSGQWYWTGQYEGGISMNVGEYFVTRMSLDIPQGAIINLASFSFEYTQKDGAPAQTNDMRLYVEAADNSALWPYVSASTEVAVGPSLGGWNFPRPLLGVSKAFTIAYPGGSTSTPDIVTLDVTNQIQPLVSRSGWEAGNYLTLAMYCVTEGSGSDLGMVAQDNDFANQHPELRITYSFEDTTAARSDVNMFYNQVLSTVEDIGTNVFYGYAQEGTTWATEVGTGRNGGDCVRVTAHPPAGQETKGFGVYEYENYTGGDLVVFGGWFYNPSSNPSTCSFQYEFVYLGGGKRMDERDTWIPFVTLPMSQTDDGALWCAGLLSPGTGTLPDGCWFRLDDLYLLRTNASEMGFTGATPDRWNADQELKETATHGVTVRRNIARTNVIEAGVVKPRRNYVRRADGIWVRADPQQVGGSRWDDVSAGTTWDSVPAAATWDSY